MDNIKKNKIKELKELISTVYHLVDDMDSDKAIELLKKQHIMNQSILTDLGVLNPDSDNLKIRELNEQLRDMESKLGESISESNISGYLIKLTQSISDFIENNYGIDITTNIEFSEHGAFIYFKYPQKFSNVSGMMKSYYNSDEEVDIENKRRSTLAKKADEHFSFLIEGSEENHNLNEIPFNQENYEKFKSILTEAINEYMPDSHVNQFDFNSTLNGIKRPIMVINTIKVSISCSQSSKALRLAFENF